MDNIIFYLSITALIIASIALGYFIGYWRHSKTIQTYAYNEKTGEILDNTQIKT